jgi:hypothetical protein
VLSLPGEALPLLAAVLTAPAPFRLAELDIELDQESRVVVGRRLAEEGVIEVIGPAA